MDTQQAQQNSERLAPSQPESKPHLWGFLQHITESMTRVDLWKDTMEYNIGRNTGSTVVFSGLKISSQHCTISWNGNVGHDSAVVVRDHSSDGTYINGKKVGKGKSCMLRDGNEIAFGTCIPQVGSEEDYRFIFRHLVSEKPTGGFNDFYDVEQTLDHGTYGTVVKAICRQTHEWYAVKKIPYRRNVLAANQVKKTGKGNEIQAADMPWSQAALAREVENMQQLKHPNICQLKEVFYEGTTLNLVLEYADGGNLQNCILDHNGLCEIDSQHITYQICSALDYMHEKGIVHRDLKPHNILLTSHTPPIVKVADFGTSKVVNGGMLRTVCGSPQYIAPEILSPVNGQGYNHLIDSWSVGVIVFSMITNTSPFVDSEIIKFGCPRTNYEVDWSILHDVGVSKEATEFIRLLLQYDPRHRMPMGEALNHRWLKGCKPVYNVHNVDELMHAVMGIDEPVVKTSPSPRKKCNKGTTKDSKGKTRSGVKLDKVPRSSGYRVLRRRCIKLN